MSGSLRIEIDRAKCMGSGNCVTVVADGAATGATPGTLLRSGRDMDAVRP